MLADTSALIAVLLLNGVRINAGVNVTEDEGARRWGTCKADHQTQVTVGS